MNRFEAANLACVGLLVTVAVAATMAARGPWWAAVLAAALGFFGGGQVVERFAPGTRLLERLGRAERR